MRKILLFGIIMILATTAGLSAKDKKEEKSSKNARTGIRFEVIPAENTIAFINGKKVGEVSKLDVVPVKPGKHTIKLLHNKDEVEVDVVVVKNQVLNFKYAFEDSGKGIGGFSGEEKEEENKAKKEEKKEGNEESEQNTE
ncbi:MAG: hypothetical protein N3B13_05520 [Deltaproteobacteria bacterium]|nr:hypothetical protein [Deltaproteobacteria bacterium]